MRIVVEFLQSINFECVSPATPLVELPLELCYMWNE